MKLRELLQQIEVIQEKLGASKVYACGGIVRDKALHRLDNISDLDLTTGDESIKYIAKEVSSVLSKRFIFNFKEMPDGHSSIVLGNLKLDFSSNFIVPDIDKYLEKMGVKSPTNMQREVFSRDFTCNSLLMKLDLKTIIDPTGVGLRDLNAKIIRTNLPPAITLTSHKNRVVRAIYLSAKLDFDVDPSIIEWVRKNPDYMKLAYSQTLEEKLTQAMEYNPQRTIKLLNEMNLKDFLPIVKRLK